MELSGGPNVDINFNATTKYVRNSSYVSAYRARTKNTCRYGNKNCNSLLKSNLDAATGYRNMCIMTTRSLSFSINTSNFVDVNVSYKKKKKDTERDKNTTVKSLEVESDLNSSNINKISLKQVYLMENLEKGLVRLKRGVAPGVDGECKANITKKRLTELSKSIKRHKYAPKANRRIQIPKPDGGVRYLGIASAIDKVVQSTLKNLLEPIVEKEFSNFSYGFRPGRGCHDALHDIKYK